jgi:hypothetical protein
MSSNSIAYIKGLVDTLDKAEPWAEYFSFFPRWQIFCCWKTVDIKPQL